ncbi:response regulator [Azospirillum sp.]|uniref:response regulator n=1 Tax=Azospirillum sp. TaxID=34012 RepID=UPI003D702F57
MANILVVEDSPAVRMAIVEVLESLGHTVTEAENGRLAVEQLAGRSFDLVVTDVLMPEVDGIEVIKAVRRAKPDTKILAISGGAPNLPAGYALKLTEMFRADAVLYKPFMNDELRQAVGELVG